MAATLVTFPKNTFGIMQATETVRYLELTAANQFRPARVPSMLPDVRQVELPYPELNRFFYTAVGGQWYWTERLVWSYADWQSYLARPGHETWMLSTQGTPAGYFELDLPGDGSVELAYFGILPQFVGRGWGGFLLGQAVARAWAKGANRVWLHTSSYDHPHALANYQRRGFQLYRTDTFEVEVAAAPPGSWPGSRPPNSLGPHRHPPESTAP